MSNLDKYIEELTRQIEEFGNLTEDEIVRFIYLSLGRKIAFDTDWLFAEEDVAGNIYNSAGTENKANCFINNDKWIVICKDIAFLLEYIGKRFGINIETVDELSTNKPYPHVYNKVTRKDGKVYYLDLFEDLGNIHTNSRTDFFGFIKGSYEDFFSMEELEKMDIKFGYITKEKGYWGDYLKNNISQLESIPEKIKAILEKPFPYIDNNRGYNERRKYVKKTIFQLAEPDNSNSWEWMDCYSLDGTKKIPEEIIFVKDDNDFIFFQFSENSNNYKLIDRDELAKKMANGLIIPDKYIFSKEYPWYSDLAQRADDYRRQRRTGTFPDFE